MSEEKDMFVESETESLQMEDTHEPDNDVLLCAEAAEEKVALSENEGVSDEVSASEEVDTFQEEISSEDVIVSDAPVFEDAPVGAFASKDAEVLADEIISGEAIETDDLLASVDEMISGGAITSEHESSLGNELDLDPSLYLEDGAGLEGSAPEAEVGTEEAVSEDTEEKKKDDRTGFQKFAAIWNGFWKWVFHLRSIGLVIPIAILAVMLALHNQAELPEMVGINLQSTGEYEQMISRNVAVYGPLALTGVCLFLTLCSRRILYPLLISIFSLALPVLIWITNTFPN